MSAPAPALNEVVFIQIIKIRFYSAIQNFSIFLVISGSLVFSHVKPEDGVGSRVYKCIAFNPIRRKHIGGSYTRIKVLRKYTVFFLSQNKITINTIFFTIMPVRIWYMYMSHLSELRLHVHEVLYNILTIRARGNHIHLCLLTIFLSIFWAQVSRSITVITLALLIRW